MPQDGKGYGSMPTKKSRFQTAKEKVAREHGRSESLAGDFKRGLALLGALMSGPEAERKAEARRKPMETATGTGLIRRGLRHAEKKSKGY